MPASTPLRPLVDELEEMTALDSVAKTVGKTVRDLVGRGEIKDAISGTWFGHAVHPPLTSSCPKQLCGTLPRGSIHGL